MTAARTPPLSTQSRDPVPLDEGLVIAVDGVSFDVPPARPSASSARAAAASRSRRARSSASWTGRAAIVGGEILFRRGAKEHGNGQVVDLAKLDSNGSEMRAVRGGEIALIFQEPMSSFSPVHTIGTQLLEAIRIHRDVSTAEARAYRHRPLAPGRRAKPGAAHRRLLVPTLRRPSPARDDRDRASPCEPSLLIADEPTTALDVTTQAQILDLLRELQNRHGMAIMLITHDLGVIAEMADDVVVMYLGEVVESAPVDAIFHDPKHPYTRALLQSIPSITSPAGRSWRPSRAASPPQ